MADLTTLENVKSWLGIDADETDSDEVLGRLVKAASTAAESFMGRVIESAEYVETRDGRGGVRLHFANFPVSAVASVSIGGAPVPAASKYGEAGYTFDKETLYLNGYTFARGLRNVEIKYTAGLPEVPADIEQAVIETVALRYKERDRIGHASKSLAGETVSFTIVDFPKSARAVLNHHKKVVPA